MTKQAPISLDPHFLGFVEDQVGRGRAGLRLLEEHEAKLRALRAALDEGEASGPAQALDFDALIAAKRRA